MKRYYIARGSFANQYELYWAEEGSEVPANLERITRKEAEAYARTERTRRKEDQNFSGYASASIFPISRYYDRLPEYNYKVIGYIAEEQ